MPGAWLALFDRDPAMIDAGSHYLQAVAAFYGLFGHGMPLYFASQGAGRLLWPLVANVGRLVVASGGGWLVLRLGASMTHVFAVQGVALAVFGLINAAAVAGGSWSGAVSPPWRRLEALPGGAPPK